MSAYAVPADSGRPAHGGPTLVPASEIRFHPSSYCDPHGRLFEWQGELYRGITPEGMPLFRRLFDDGLTQRLVDKGLLVETRPTQWQVEGYPLVIWHRRVPFVSYAPEWCGPMLKAAALSTIDLEAELAPAGLSLMDPNPWNLLFDATRPVYVDLGSIAPAPIQPDNPWDGYGHFFCTYFLRPLQLIAAGHGRMARALARDYDHCLLESDVHALVPAPHKKLGIRSVLKANTRVAKNLLRPLLRRGESILHRARETAPMAVHPTRPRFLRWLREHVDQLPMPSELMLNETSIPASADPDDACRAEQQAFAMLLEELRPASVLEAGGQGGCALLAARSGVPSVLLDEREAVIADCYRQARTASLPVLPLVIDLRFPSPGSGICNIEFPPATERLACDLVVTFEAVHKLALGRELTFDQIARSLGAFSRRWVLARFVHPEDPTVRALRALSVFPNYHLAEFESALRRQFRGVRTIGPADGTTTLFLCDKGRPSTGDAAWAPAAVGRARGD